MTATTIALGWYLLVGGWGVPNNGAMAQVRVEIGPFQSQKVCEENKTRLANVAGLGIGDCEKKGK